MKVRMLKGGLMEICLISMSMLGKEVRFDKEAVYFSMVWYEGKVWFG